MNKLVNFLSFYLVVALFTAGCATTQFKPSPIELRAMQTREFAAPSAAVFAAGGSVIQDEGLSIRSSDFTSGIISAEGDAAKASRNLISILTGGPENTLFHRECTAHVERLGEGKCSVRMNFSTMQTIRYSDGTMAKNGHPIEDGGFYTHLFELLDRAVYLRANLP
jgi:hypothetical protein